MKRIRMDAILKDLERKMVFLVGPRQTGKTYLAQQIGEQFKKTVYLNYDSLADRKTIEQGAWLPESELLIIDELHKMPNWKNVLKGIWDTRPARQKILVTGSARLDTFRQSGDSLAGRFYCHRLLPLSQAELTAIGHESSFDFLMERGGFPEPFLAENALEAARWRIQYFDSLLREDIIDFRRILDLRTMRLVMEMLRERIGSPLSYSSIARDLGVSPNTAAKYVAILEALYIVFLVRPYSRNIARSILKEPKVYFFDTGLVKGDPGKVFENLVALSLLKDAWARIDLDAEEVSLHYLRTKDGEEVDFCLTGPKGPELFLESKASDTHVSNTLRKFKERYGIRSIQLVKDLKTESILDGIELRRAKDWLSGLRE